MKKVLLLLVLVAWNLSAQTDCFNALPVCGNTNFEDLTLDGFGTQEVSSCGSEEHNSLWLKLHVVTSGTLAFDIVPASPDINEDFDFFLFNYRGCDNLTQVRCSTTNPAAAALTTNVTGMRDSENDSTEGPGPAGNSFVKSVNVAAGQTLMLVIDRPFGNSNFSVVWTGTAVFDDPPVIPPLPEGVATLDIFKCDTDGVQDGATLFNLAQNTPHILGDQTGITVEYYDNFGDATLGFNAIPDPETFFNTADPQTIYVRVTNPATGCFITTEFQIGLNNEVALENDEFVVCDDATDGDSTNGQAVFNLADVTEAILPYFDDQGFVAEYFLTQADAQNGIGALGPTFYNTLPGEQTIFVKANAGLCSSIKPLKLKVRNFSALPPATLVQCDYGTPDGISVFDLSTADDTFTGGTTGLTIQYFENSAALAANTPLPSVYTNTTNPQTLIAKITDNVLGCSATNSLTLQVNAVVAQTIAPLQKCDMAGTGLAQFNLNDAAVVLMPQQAAVFYASSQDALLQQNPIPNPASYNIPTAYQSSVFVRIDDAVAGCSGISEIVLKVNSLPTVSPAGNALICINQPGYTVAIDAGPLAAGSYTYAWRFNNTPLPDTTYSINADQVGTYTVTVTNASGCSTNRTIAVFAADVPFIESATIDGRDVWLNLNQANTGAYGFSIDQPDGPFQFDNFFAGVSCGPHIAYVDSGNGCGTTSFPFEVTIIPAFFTPNGDGFSEQWNIGCGWRLPNTRISIFDRFGKLLQQFSASAPGWDGTYNGQPMPSDDYWYIMETADGKTSKGHFSLKR